MIGIAGDKSVERVAILLPAIIEEIDEPEPVLALMILSRWAATEYNEAVRAMQTVVWNGRPVEQRALADHAMTVVQKDESAVPIAVYLPAEPSTQHAAFWDAVQLMRGADDYCAIPLRPEECPTLDEFAALGEAIDVDDLSVNVYALGFEWNGTATKYDSQIRIGNLPRFLIDDIVSGKIDFGAPYWEGQ